MFTLSFLTSGRTPGIMRNRLLPWPARTRLIDALTDTPPPSSQALVTTRIQQLSTTLQPTLLEADAAYQRFVQTYIDPLFGRKRHTYMTRLAGEHTNQLSVSAAERMTNYRLALGSMALVASVLGVLIHPAFTSVAIVLG
ncbi:MAG: hypothetical protein GYB64_11755, partial [Chloroflexi bacterium]|nr:hypothetical protein [Chloroflexota bacterium]